MENAGFGGASRQDSKLLTALLDVSNLVSSTLELEPLLEAILDKLGAIIEYRSARIFIIEGGRARVAAQRPGHAAGGGSEFPMLLRGQLLQERKPVVIGDLYSGSGHAEAFRESMGGSMNAVYGDARCWMGLPMAYKNKIVGVLALDHVEPGFYKDYHVEIGMAFANQAAIEYENIRLYREITKKADEIGTLFSIQKAITSRLELDSVLRLIAGEARRLTNSDSTAVFLADGDELVLSVSSGFSGSDLAGLRIPVHGSAVGECLQKRDPVILDVSCFKGFPGERLVDATGMRSCLCVPLAAGSRPVGVIAAFGRTEGEFNAEDERIFGMFAQSAVIGIENARLYEEEKRRLAENEQRRRVAEGLRDVLKALNSNKDIDEILDFIAKEAAGLLHADSATLFRLGDDRRTLIPEASCGIQYHAPGEAIDANTGIMGKAFMERRPVVIWDMAGIEEPYGTSRKNAGDHHPGWVRDNCCGIMAVPLVCKDEVYGGFVFYFKKGEKQQKRAISKEEIGLAMTLADQAALAIDNTRLRKQAEDMAVAAERNRLARDLHDAVTQTLFSASLIADVVPRIWEKNREEGQKRLEELKQLTRGALAEMRMLLFELRPAALAEAPLGDLLRQLSEAAAGRARIPVLLDVKGAAVLPPEVKTVFYRVAQEALNNITRHSGAKRAEIGLTLYEDEQKDVVIARLVIKDDGRGFESGTVAAGHFGLGIMKERAEAVGAKLGVESKPGGGTVVVLEWPGSRQLPQTPVNGKNPG